MKWADEYNLGISEIDKQHQHIITAINVLETAVLKKQTGEVLSKVSKALHAYARSHFDYEEKLLEKHHYPDLQGQLEEHSAFIIKIKEFDRNISDTVNLQKLGMKMCNFLREWLIDHILEEDKKYLPYMRDQVIVP